MSFSPFKFITNDLVKAIGGVNVILDVFACYIIVRHSTTAMAQYKWILLLMTQAPAIADAIIAFLVFPIRINGAVGIHFQGPLPDLLPLPGNVYAV
ncbi:hypothetical protein ANCCAN_26240 [Ancylostoma caninum]|uniref:Uncharacterized protein n=1 Tax=Ancylostoma caninum TaxID=29170 RepID=A0A368F7J1_ANCCA|nr:hypothetical protein ANCCAN_26240 [Ancylostoma caninum]